VFIGYQFIGSAANSSRHHPLSSFGFALLLFQLMLGMVRPGPHNSHHLLDTELAILLNPSQLVGRGFASRHDLTYSI